MKNSTGARADGNGIYIYIYSRTSVCKQLVEIICKSPDDTGHCLFFQKDIEAVPNGAAHSLLSAYTIPSEKEIHFFDLLNSRFGRERDVHVHTHIYTHTLYIYIYIHTFGCSALREEERRDEMESKREIRSGSLWKEEAIRRRGKKKRVTAKYRALPPVQIPWTQLSETVSLINLTFRVCYRESPFFLTVPRLNWSPSDRFFFFLSSFFFFSLLS